MNKKLISGAAVGALAAAALIGATAGSAAPSAAVNPPAAAKVAGASPSSFADIVERVAPAVVSIDMEGKVTKTAAPSRGGSAIVPPANHPPKEGTGSGFFISADGYIVTNNHVVDDAEKLTVRLSDGRSLSGRLVGVDPATDLAVVKVEGKGFPFVSFEDTAKPRVGDWVIAVGNPFNLGGTATAGIVSALGRQNVSDSSYVDYMQIDAPINSGNSGGPTFDVYGRVVGVNTAILSPSGGSVGIGFDIPADVVAQVAKQLIANGKVTRGYIGATVQSLTPEIAESLGVSPDKGALVADLAPDGPSAKAGLKQGDLVLRINGKDVASSTDLTRQVALVQAGGDIRLEVSRDGKLQTVVVRSGERPAEAVLRKASASSDDEDEGEGQ